MKRKIVYTLTAQTNIRAIARYIGKTHGRAAQVSFRKKIENTLNTLAESPEIWPEHVY